MRVLVLWADDHSPNLGVRALGAGTQALAHRTWPGADVSFHSYGSGASAPVPIGSVHAVVAAAVRKRTDLSEWYRSFDVILDSRAGDSFASIYGLSRLSGMTAATEFAHAVGVPVVLTPQTIGPFQTRMSRAFARRSLRTASLVMARDGHSADAAAKLGRPVDVRTTDVVFALDVPAPDRERDVVLNISGLLWRRNSHVDHDAYRATVRAVHDRLVADGRKVSLLAHVLPSDGSDDDVPAVREFASTLPGTEVLIPDSLVAARQMLAGAALVIGSRMHACLNALSVGTPAIPLAYSRKFAPLLADLGWTNVVDLRESTEAVPAQVAGLASSQLDRQVAEVRSKAQASLATATEAMSMLGMR